MSPVLLGFKRAPLSQRKLSATAVDSVIVTGAVSGHAANQPPERENARRSSVMRLMTMLTSLKSIGQSKKTVNKGKYLYVQDSCAII